MHLEGESVADGTLNGAGWGVGLSIRCLGQTDLSCIKPVSLTSWRPLVINNRHSSLACGFISFTLAHQDFGLLTLTPPL
ncbi:unnamed protein product [Gadus morhua 'NCC']